MSAQELSLKWLFFSIRGRIARQSYILSVLFLVLPQIVLLAQLVRADQSGDEGSLVFWFLVWLASVLVTLWSLIALAVKRLHDLGVTGWLALTMFFPVARWILLIVLAIMPSKQEVNEYGPPPFPD